jgi:hypothetical protein
MKNQKLTKTKNAVVAPKPTLSSGMDSGEINFTPSHDEVARKAYLAYENQRSEPGHEVQHWLRAEADLIMERNLTHVHGYHDRV